MPMSARREPRRSRIGNWPPLCRAAETNAPPQNRKIPSSPARPPDESITHCNAPLTLECSLISLPAQIPTCHQRRLRGRTCIGLASGLRLEEPALAAFEAHSSQHARPIRPSIQPDSVAANVDLVGDRVAVDDNEAVIVLILEERLPDPRKSDSAGRTADARARPACRKVDRSEVSTKPCRMLVCSGILWRGRRRPGSGIRLARGG